MISKKQVQREAKQVFHLCLVNGRLDEDRTLQAVRYITGAGYRACPAILANFLRLVKLDRERHTAHIESAAPLPPDVTTAIQGGMERRYGPGLSTDFVVHSSLIGGVRVRIGSDVYDGTVQAQLAALESSF